MLKKSIPQHKRMAMGGGHTALGYARGGMVAPMPAAAGPRGAAMTGNARPAAPAAERATSMPVRSPMAPTTRGPSMSPVKPAPTMMKTGGGVRAPSAPANAVKQPLTAARSNNGLKGMKSGGSAGKKC